MKETRRSITLINTQLIHQFAFRHADAVNLVLLRAGITLFIVSLANNKQSYFEKETELNEHGHAESVPINVGMFRPI